MTRVAGTWPALMGPVMAIGISGIALISLAMTDAERPWLLGALLLVAIVPWVINAFLVSEPCPPESDEAPAGWHPGHRVATELTFVLTVGAMVVLHPLGHAVGVADPDGNSQASLLILLIAVAESAASRSMVTCIVLTVSTITIVVVASAVGPTYDSAGIWIGATVFTLLGGLLVRRLQRSMADLAAAQAALAGRAAAEERQRIAREVHDVIAHSMTVTMLHVTAARMAVLRGDDADAVEALEEAERAGRASLTDIRTTVGLLRDDAAATAAAAPGAGDLAQLLDGYRAAGMRIDADVDDRLGSVPPAVGLAVYRVVQEALANVAKHAPGATARVRVGATGQVEVEVVDDGPGASAVTDGAGHGLLGMRERVEALGGRLEAGVAAAGGGWRVRAVIP